MKTEYKKILARRYKQTLSLFNFLSIPQEMKQAEQKHTVKSKTRTKRMFWADFDTACKYAKENGGVCLVYALDGKENIACIDLDGCMDGKGDFSDLAAKAFKACEGSYIEKSVSGKGLHIFGKTKGSDLRSYSREKDMEYYRGNQGGKGHTRVHTAQSKRQCAKSIKRERQRWEVRKEKRLSAQNRQP